MRKFILGTDWWTDCDDAVAVRLIARFVKEKKAQLLGVGLNAAMEYSGASLMGFMREEGLGDVPVGIDLEATDFGRNPAYQKHLAETTGMPITNRDLPDAVRLYRRILADATEKIEIMEIGYFQVITAVLESGPDDISEKTGLELFKEKVKKVWAMAGKWDGDGEKENNFCRNPRSRVAGEAFCRLCPVPVTFLGWEVGVNVLTGGHLKDGDLLHQIMKDHGSENGRHSWDPMLVLMALNGNEEAAGYKTVRGFASVDADTGANHFREDSHGPHRYVVKIWENEAYQKQINALL
ncbi:MAG: hypothetical protein E7329_02890 [Clostridiales bacterium]|nr:hypothetical protein [Clostridiales bacterium]